MTYATRADLETRRADEFRASAPRDIDGGIDEAAVDRSLSYADALINEKLGVRYTVPLVEVPVSIVDMAVDIALYDLSTGTAFTEDKETRYKAAVARLEALAAGKSSLGLLDKPAAERGKGSYSGQERRFTRDKLKDLT